MALRLSIRPTAVTMFTPNSAPIILVFPSVSPRVRLLMATFLLTVTLCIIGVAGCEKLFRFRRFERCRLMCGPGCPGVWW